MVGVFDTVGSVGLPEELSFRSNKLKSVFGFPDKLLGEHVARAYQALAINEPRADFVRIDINSVMGVADISNAQVCAKFEQTDGGRQKGQVLKQVSISFPISPHQTNCELVLVYWYVKLTTQGTI